MSNAFDILTGLSNVGGSPTKRIMRAPFGWIGGKSRSVQHILPLLPQRDGYVEVFGGSGAVLLARAPSKLEVFNDRYAGVVAFYRCIRDVNKMQRMVDMLELLLHSREEFLWARESWKNCEDDVERAARWYYMHKTSFAQRGCMWGRSTTPVGAVAHIASGQLNTFPALHARLRNVQVENLDWRECLDDYDHPDTVFYLDPPYVDSYAGAYEHELTQDDHRELLRRVFAMDAFVAVSGLSNPLYDENDWDERYEWDVRSTAKGINCSDGDKREHIREQDSARGTQREMLWIKESS